MKTPIEQLVLLALSYWCHIGVAQDELSQLPVLSRNSHSCANQSSFSVGWRKEAFQPMEEFSCILGQTTFTSTSPM